MRALKADREAQDKTYNTPYSEETFRQVARRSPSKQRRSCDSATEPQARDIKLPSSGHLEDNRNYSAFLTYALQKELHRANHRLMNEPMGDTSTPLPHNRKPLAMTNVAPISRLSQHYQRPQLQTVTLPTLQVQNLNTQYKLGIFALKTCWNWHITGSWGCRCCSWPQHFSCLFWYHVSPSLLNTILVQRTWKFSTKTGKRCRCKGTCILYLQNHVQHLCYQLMPMHCFGHVPMNAYLKLVRTVGVFWSSKDCVACTCWQQLEAKCSFFQRPSAMIHTYKYSVHGSVCIYLQLFFMIYFSHRTALASSWITSQLSHHARYFVKNPTKTLPADVPYLPLATAYAIWKTCGDKIWSLVRKIFMYLDNCVQVEYRGFKISLTFVPMTRLKL